MRDEWFKGLQTAQSVLQFASLWREAGPLRSGSPSWIGMRSKQLWSRRPQSAIQCCSTALLTRAPSAVLRRLKASNAEIERALAIERGPEQPEESFPTLVRRWLSQVGPAARICRALDASDGQGAGLVSRGRGNSGERRSIDPRRSCRQRKRCAGARGQWPGSGKGAISAARPSSRGALSQSAGPAPAPGQKAAPVNTAGFALAAALGNVAGCHGGGPTPAPGATVHRRLPGLWCRVHAGRHRSGRDAPGPGWVP